jgi:hypothetical protein
MAPDNKKMITYTEKDFSVLLDIIGTESIRTFSNDPFFMVSLKHYDTGIGMPQDNLKALILRQDLTEVRYAKSDLGSSVSDEIYKFLHYIPFNKLPLHLHEYPELVKWRLTIGK